jgi:glycosyltransferase involved in cell wall biosynthesis
MGLELSTNLQSIDSVILIDYPWYSETERLSYDNVAVLARADHTSAARDLREVIASLDKDRSRKLLFIESSWGISKLFSKSRNYLIPMWEQASTELESRSCGNMISVTKFGQAHMAKNGIASRYLPFPVQKQTRKPITELRTILHNAGSYGGAFRKGTPEAVMIFQRSGLADKGVELRITALTPPNDELQQIIERKPNGIRLDVGFRRDWRDIYETGDLLLYPSRTEGHSLPVLEANSFGIPALSTDFGPIAEYDDDPRFKIPVANQNGNRAFVNIDEGAEKLISIHQMSLQVKSAEVYENVSQNFSWDALAPLYDRMLN